MRITSVTSVRDEGPYLLEWLAWHRLLGVTDFLVASNDCRDGCDRLLDVLAGHGVLRHLPQPPMAELGAEKGNSLDLGLIRDDSVLDYNDLPDPAESAEEAVANLEGLQGVELFDRQGHAPA